MFKVLIELLFEPIGFFQIGKLHLRRLQSLMLTFVIFIHEAIDSEDPKTAPNLSFFISVTENIEQTRSFSYGSS